MDWYPHYIGDYDADTIHLSAFEDGVYMRLLRWYYREERPLPDGDQAWASIARIGLSEWLPIRDTIRAFFVARMSRVTNATEWHHRRCNEVIRAQNKRRRDGAKRQGKLRKHGILGGDLEMSRVSNAPIGEEKKEVVGLSLSTTSESLTKTESADRTARVAKNANAPDHLGEPPSAKPARAKRPKVERHPMPVDWVPSAQAFEVGRAMGLTDDETGSEAAECRWYWTDGPGKGTERPGWDATFLGQLKRRAREIIARRIGNGSSRPERHNGRSGGVLTEILGECFALEDRNQVPGRKPGGDPIPRMGINGARAKPGAIPGFGPGPLDNGHDVIDGDFSVVGQTQGEDHPAE